MCISAVLGRNVQSSKAPFSPGRSGAVLSRLACTAPSIDCSQRSAFLMQVASAAAHPVFAEMLKSINAVLDEDVQSSKTPFVNRTQQCFAVKTGTDSFLDLARASFCRISEDVHKLTAAYSEQFKLTLKVRESERTARREMA